MIESEDDKYINKSLYKNEKNYLILSSYVPTENEIAKIKDKNNCYQIIKRSGFVNSSSYSEEPQRENKFI